MSDDNNEPAQRPSGAFLALRRPPQPGDILDGTYRIDEVLGYGAVGVVCAAWHLHVQRPCAVKYLHPQLVSNPELRARFRREAQSAFQLGHPHIVAITDFRDEAGAWPYIVMELVNGEMLRTRLERGEIPPPLSVRLMMELCDALHTAHRRGVIHRDLKPENLFLTREEAGKNGEPEGRVFLKVLDFGLSKILDESDITETGRLLGSPSYMSPEQAKGDSHLVDARSDIFAVGALLYECLTSYKLFEAPSFEIKRHLIMEGKLPVLKLVQRGMPEALEHIIRMCCAKLPEDRYQTAAAVGEALSRVYPGEALSGRWEVSGRTSIAHGGSGQNPAVGRPAAPSRGTMPPPQPPPREPSPQPPRGTLPPSREPSPTGVPRGTLPPAREQQAPSRESAGIPRGTVPPQQVSARATVPQQAPSRESTGIPRGTVPAQQVSARATVPQQAPSRGSAGIPPGTVPAQQVSERAIVPQQAATRAAGPPQPAPSRDAVPPEQALWEALPPPRATAPQQHPYSRESLPLPRAMMPTPHGADPVSRPMPPPHPEMPPPQQHETPQQPMPPPQQREMQQQQREMQQQQRETSPPQAQEPSGEARRTSRPSQRPGSARMGIGMESTLPAQTQAARAADQDPGDVRKSTSRNLAVDTTRQNASMDGAEGVASGATQPRAPRRAGLWFSVIGLGLLLGGGSALIGYRYLFPEEHPVPVTQPSGDPPKVAGPRHDHQPSVEAPVHPRQHEPRDHAQTDHEARGPAVIDDGSKKPRQLRAPQLEQLTIAEVDEVMHKGKHGIAHCYPREKALPQRITIEAMVAPTGRVTEATADVDEDVAGCVVDAVRGLRFPSFHSTDAISVHYEFVNMQR